LRALTLKEFAEDMRRKGDIREADLADEILALIDIEEEVAEPYSTLCDDLNIHAPTELKDKPEKALEWLGDRSNLLADIEEELKQAGREGDADDAVKEMIDTLADAEKILEEHGWPGTDFLDALENLAENAPTPTEYDL
jgi:hypothetical protein